ncbi:hypothetical protein MTR67_028111, partial [Solanum verrucosum]
PCFMVKTLKTNHNCEDAFINPRACISTLAQYLKSKLQNNPQYKLKDMRKDLNDQCNLNASTSKLKGSKRVALQKLQGSFLDDFNRIEAYANELRLRNFDSDIVINLSKDGLKQDGTFLKGQRKGQLLVAMEQDSQNCFYPLAWAIVDNETTRIWILFLQLLNNSLNLKDGETVIFMYNIQKGLIETIKNVLHLSQHRYCVRKIETNWMKRYRSEMKKLFWWAAWSTYEEDFKDQLITLGALSKSVAKDLLRYPPQTWCRAYLDTICKNQMMDNNFTESFNSWILKARGKPILKMLKDIRINIMNRSAHRPTQNEEYHIMPTPELSQQQYEPFGPTIEPESDPYIRPPFIYENHTKLKMRMNQQRATKNKVISFRGDHAGISDPTYLPYSRTKLTWKGKEVVTDNQLERERHKKLGS